jgi:endogenous inhibitor of DNA gyrase (YacG/DUF329 family)
MNGDIKKCAQCGKEMKARKSTKRYCSNACKQAAFYVRNAQVLAYDKDNRSGISHIEERAITRWLIYCYTVTIHNPCLSSYPYYEEPVGSKNQPQPNEATGAPTCSDKQGPLQTILPSGIYGPLKQARIYYHHEYKQVIPIYGVQRQGAIAGLGQEAVPSKRALNRQPKIRQLFNKRQVFTVTKGCSRIRAPAFPKGLKAV